MITVYEGGAWLIHGRLFPEKKGSAEVRALLGDKPDKAAARRGTIAWSILEKHNGSDESGRLSIHFDCLASHDITYVNIIQTAKASGLDAFPVPYVLTNCHNSLCAVGGTINGDDHLFGLSCAKRYGGIFVPPHLAVIHTYVREMHAACGAMILGSDSHTRYGSAGTLGIGEGGGELVKQLLGKSYDIACPSVVAVHLTGAPHPGVGPHDVALALTAAVFKNGVVKNKILEFIGDGVGALPMDFRNGIDTMTTETACLSSIWRTDAETERFFRIHGRHEDYRRLEPADVAYYDGLIEIDLSAVEPMIALPFHPSNAFPIREVQKNPGDYLRQVEMTARDILEGSNVENVHLTDKVRNGKLHVDQGIIAGCAGGTFDNIIAAAECLASQATGSGNFSLSVYPSSQPVMMALGRDGALNTLMGAGATVRTAFCGPCFGAGDVPANSCLSIRHTTRNFPNREGSRPTQRQMAYVALMDARSIAATACHGGVLTAGTEIEWSDEHPAYAFDSAPYASRVYNGFGQPDASVPLVRGPNIVDWPSFASLPDHLLLGVASVLDDPVTTTDEIIPSGDSSSYRSNPVAMAEFTLSRRDPGYVGRAKAYRAMEEKRLAGDGSMDAAQREALSLACSLDGVLDAAAVGFGSVIYANKPGDGSAREQAASCQRILGGRANVAREYATKRYRSNLINWGIIPFLLPVKVDMQNGDFLFLPNIRRRLLDGEATFRAWRLRGGEAVSCTLETGELTPVERKLIVAGCLINSYRGE